MLEQESNSIALVTAFPTKCELHLYNLLYLLYGKLAPNLDFFDKKWELFKK